MKNDRNYVVKLVYSGDHWSEISVMAGKYNWVDIIRPQVKSGVNQEIVFSKEKDVAGFLEEIISLDFIESVFISRKKA